MLTQIFNRLPVLVRSALDRRLDAPSLLTQNHMKVESLLLQLKVMNRAYARISSRRDEIQVRANQVFEQLQSLLIQHFQMEEVIFYPECEKLEDLKEKVATFREEHDRVKDLLAELSPLSLSNPDFISKLNELARLIMHHAREEEEVVFPAVRKAWSHSRLDRLANQMRSLRKPEKKSEAQTAA